MWAINRIEFSVGLFFILFSFVASVQSQSSLVKTGEMAPGIFLRDLTGQDFFLSDYCGAPRQSWKPQRIPVVISFFATYCIPCQQEIPELSAIAQEYDGRVKFFLIDVKEQQSKVTSFVQQKNITLPVLLDKYGVIAKNYNVEALPNLFVIDQKGIITFVQRGYDNKIPAKLKAHLERFKE